MNISSNHKILVVDDDELVRSSMKEYFTTQGYVVDCAEHAVDAQELTTCNHYSAVIADLCFTDTNEAEALDMVGSIRERSPLTRIILLATYGSAYVELEARRRGADAFLRKPKPLPQVAQIMCGLLGQNT